jgi:proteasome accessory factor C
MDRFDRIFQLHRILAARRTPVSRGELQEQLECSRATVQRSIEDMRDFLGAPIVYDRQRNGYIYDVKTGGHPYELPGLWFNADELYALLTTHRLLCKIQPGLLDAWLAPFRQRIESILQGRESGSGEIAQRVRILQTAARPVNVEHFRILTTALVKRRRVRVLYHGRARDATTERTVSPQRLVYYRDNWYLDAWCHSRRALRTFSLDRLHPIYIDDQLAREVNEVRLDAHFTHAYGIFAGPASHTAVLQFTPEAARWVADEHWHPHQEGEILPNGGYRLRIPYGRPEELVRDILKYGPEVEVLAPKSLRQAVAWAHGEAFRQYEDRAATDSRNESPEA